MVLDYTQVRPVELTVDLATSLILRRPRKIKHCQQKQNQAEGSAAMETLASHLGQKGSAYYYSSTCRLPCFERSFTDVDSSNNSMRLHGARDAGIPFYLSDLFTPHKDANQRHRQSNVMMTREEPESESRTSDSSYNQDQFLKPHQNGNMTDVIIGLVIGERAWKIIQRFSEGLRRGCEGPHETKLELLGACLVPECRALVIELVEQGSLWAVLRTRQRQLTDDMRAQFVFDTSRGMSYLHKFELPILHRDMTSPNLLVECDFSIKISDFGLHASRHKSRLTGNCGTVQWMAPEVLGDRKYTEKADVFSFGIVVWEIFTGQCPYEGMTQIQVALGVLNNDLRPPFPRFIREGSEGNATSNRRPLLFRCRTCKVHFGDNDYYEN
ncbi:hypothetical protein PsorP6_015436 [Peronosclerospora sorghi]|uniref:Uncharacterized protein n=1 Tax=Peronosclerospora sorghi TaxID=230839 RepID=A0ACC0WPA9_9STRA|nr:hypothetical protein PsorP6_015436 [Peronosclerospora sorghi]